MKTNKTKAIVNVVLIGACVLAGLAVLQTVFSIAQDGGSETRERLEKYQKSTN